MPIYEYRCEKCGGEFEKLTPLAHAHKTQECVNCGGVTAIRILSVTSLGGSGGDSGPSCGPAGFG